MEWLTFTTLIVIFTGYVEITAEVIDGKQVLQFGK